jgi:protein O-GlcNAc transferase
MPELTLQQALDHALQLHQAGNLAAAEPIYRQILAVEPQHADVLHFLGVLTHQAGRHDEALKLLGQALAIHPAWPDALSNRGEVLRSCGRFEEAVACYKQAIALVPEFASAHNNLGNAYSDLGMTSEAIASCRRAIELDSQYPEAWNNLGNALQSSGQLTEAIAAFHQAIALRQDFCEAYNNLGVALQENQRTNEAIAAFRQAIALKPEYVAALNNLGVALKDVGQLEEALVICRQALALAPADAAAHYNLGNILKDLGQTDEAIVAYRQAIAIQSNHADAHNNLANALQDKGLLDEAIAAVQQAIALKADDAKAYSNLGNFLNDQGRLDAAVVAFQQALALEPDSAVAHSNMGNVIQNQGQHDAAVAAHRRAIALKPDYAGAYNNYGNVMKDQGLVDAAIETYQKALALEPTNHCCHGNLLLTMEYSTSTTQASIAAAQQHWYHHCAEPLSKEIRPFTNGRNPERRLRIGYVSPDLRNHPVGRFILPLWENHDRRNYEIFAYAQVVKPDAVTRQLRAQTDSWRNTVGLTDAAVSEMIRADGIDILVDLAMHTANNRLLVFARKPAPVQVNYLAYVGSSGLPTMDYRLSDRYLDLPGKADSVYVEQTIRLPATYWCYQPMEIAASLKLSERKRDGVTFGCLNNFTKVNDSVLDRWAEILRSVPGSKLIVHAPLGSVRERMLEHLRLQGITAERITFMGKVSAAEYLRMHESIDIALDTFPYAGGTTTCDALWMGTPVVTMAGERGVGRGGVSILSNVGLPELIAQRPAEYVEIAVTMANDAARLRELRESLRERMQASPLMNAPRFARDVESAYREMWRAWCRQA